jgi:hypothetical protein
MQDNSFLKGPALTAALFVLLTTVAWPVPAQTVPGPAATPVAAHSKDLGFSGGSPLVIPAAAFSSDGIDPANYVFWFVTGAIEGVDSPPAGYAPCLKAPVYLPQGALVYQFWASIYDNDGGYNVGVNLRRVDNFSGASSISASVISTGASTTIQSVGDYSIARPIVQYPLYSYYATLCLNGSATKVYSVRVWYLEPIFADDFESGTTTRWASVAP